MNNVVIIGGGPAGLTAAYFFSKAGHQVTLIDAGETLGGCHRVIRNSNGLFAEHAPRVYSDSYVNTIAVMRDMGMAWDEYFTEYDFSITSIASRGAFGHLGVREVIVLAFAFVLLLLGFSGTLQSWSVADVGDKFGFSEGAKDYLDRVCRLTDGAPADRYSLWQFLQLVNQQMVHTLYQPRVPTDQGLFKVWETVLESHGVKIHKNTRVTGIDPESLTVHNGAQSWNYTHCILAIPPASAMAIQGVHDAFPNMTPDWIMETDYLPYISMSFHYSELPESVTKTHGFPETEWAVVYIAVSEYWDNKQPGVLSVTISRPDAVSSYIGKSAQQCDSAQEIIDEVVRQLNIPQPLEAFLTPGTTRMDNTWHLPDTAYVAAASTKPLPFHSPTHPDSLFTLGTHNGKSWYQFTAMEAAVENALHLCQSQNVTDKLTPTRAWSVRSVVSVVILMMIIVIYLF